MLRNDFLIFGKMDTRQFGVGIYGNQLAKAPERDREFVSVPGRNGDVILDNGRYNNITVPYKAYIIDNYNANIRGLRNALFSQHGYQRLEDTINPEEFRLAEAIPFDIDEAGVLRAGEFEMQFNCKPQRFLKSGERIIEITSATTIMSPYLEDAKPLIRAYGTGDLIINDIEIDVVTANGYTDIDCDLMEAYKDTMAVNCNNNIMLMSGEFPKLSYGANTITFTGFSKLEIKPRWWIL